MNPLFQLSDISFRYPQSSSPAALQHLSLDIRRSEFTALVGEVGSGKSTLLKILAGLLKPTGGKLFYNTSPLSYYPAKLRELRKSVGISFQSADNQIFEATVKSEAVFGLKNFGFAPEEASLRAERTLQLFGLPPLKFTDRSPFSLSGGERKKLALASIFALEPEFLLLDEPVSGLDNSGKLILNDALRKHKEQGKGCIIVTHDLDFAAEICNEVIILKEGELHYKGSKEVFYDANMMREASLHPPEIVQAWKELQASGKAPGQSVYSVEEANFYL